MKIGIVGAGNIGGSLHRRLTALGHDVSFANSRGPETLSDLAAETGATAATAENAVNGAELVVLTIPVHASPTCPRACSTGLRPAPPIVDTGNQLPQQGRTDRRDRGRTAGEPLGRTAARTARHQDVQHDPRPEPARAGPAGSDGRIALSVAGGDPAAKQTVARLVEELGFDPIDAGGLDGSWRQQPGTLAYEADLDSDTLRRARAEASPERPDPLRG